MHCNNQKKLFAFKHPRIILVLICAQFWRSPPNFDPLVGFNLNVLIKSKAVVQRCSVKKVLLEISQNSRENTCARVSPVPESQACNVIKNTWHRCFPVNFVKFLRTSFLQNTSGGCFCKVCFDVRIFQVYVLNVPLFSYISLYKLDKSRKSKLNSSKLNLDS